MSDLNFDFEYIMVKLYYINVWNFLGYQEFFKEFIDISNSAIFYQCLKDNISNEVENVKYNNF